MDNMVDRFRFGHRTHDENFIHCSGTDGTEVAFDWYQHWEDNNSGIYALGYFETLHPKPNPQKPDPPAAWMDCSEPDRWNPSESVFYDIFEKKKK
jgi:hypothetical protein